MEPEARVFKVKGNDRHGTQVIASSHACGFLDSSGKFQNILQLERKEQFFLSYQKYRKLNI